jgi:hypothetical protein
MTRPPPASASIVMAVMASVVAGRAANCTTAVPSLTRDVCAARKAKGDKASQPYASAVHTEW